MQFFKTLLTTIFTIFTTLLISRKFGIASTDKDVLEKQYILYNSWYTKISKNSKEMWIWGLLLYFSCVASSFYLSEAMPLS